MYKCKRSYISALSPLYASFSIEAFQLSIFIIYVCQRAGDTIRPVFSLHCNLCTSLIINKHCTCRNRRRPVHSSCLLRNRNDCIRHILVLLAFRRMLHLVLVQ